MEDHQKLLEFAYGLAEKAAAMIRDGAEERWKSSADTSAKKNSVDLVTATDQGVEMFIRNSIKERYPNHLFIGEESYDAGERQEITDEYTWIVDPIDGTMNFVHSYPSVACSIGITYKAEPLIGVIAEPFRNRIVCTKLTQLKQFSALKGNGAWMNRTVPVPLTAGIPQPLENLSQCLIAAEWGSDRSGETFEAKARSFVRLAGDPAKGVKDGRMVHALRTSGSSACNIAAVIAGELDMYWDAGQWAWDVTAGAAILNECGGYYSGGKAAFAKQAPFAEIAMSHRWVCVRAAPGTRAETSLEIQRRLVEELYEAVEEWTTDNMRANGKA